MNWISTIFFIPIWLGEFDAELEGLTEPGIGDDWVVIDELELDEDEVFELPAFRSVHIKKLIARDGGRIRFPVSGSGANAGAGANGGDASDQRLFIDVFDGHAVVESRGGDGGNGRDGRHGQAGLVGGKGRDAPRLLFWRIGRGEQGQAGQPGENGDDGENGGDGGRGGNVQIYFMEKSLGSQILVDVSGGRAGRAGLGGRGGLGGAGGPGGRGTQVGPQGPMGSHGQPGHPGRPGKPGAAGQAHVMQVDRQQYFCLLLWDRKVIETEEEFVTCLSS